MIQSWENHFQKIQSESMQIQEDFINTVINSQKSQCEKLHWELYKQIRISIPIFLKKIVIPKLQSHLHLEQKSVYEYIEEEENNYIKKANKNISNQRVCNDSISLLKLQQTMHYRTLIKSILDFVSKFGLEKEYQQILVAWIFSNQNQQYKQNQQQKVVIVNRKYKIVALLLYVYQFSMEKQKNVFNIQTVWSQVFPQNHMWNIEHNNYSIAEQQLNNSNDSHRLKSQKRNIQQQNNNNGNNNCNVMDQLRELEKQFHFLTVKNVDISQIQQDDVDDDEKEQGLRELDLNLQSQGNAFIINNQDLKINKNQQEQKDFMIIQIEEEDTRTPYASQ